VPGDRGVCPLRARSHGDSRTTTDHNGQNVTGRVPEDILLTDRHRPLLCTAGLPSVSVSVSMQPSTAPLPTCQSSRCPQASERGMVANGWEWISKAGEGSRPPWVQIPPLPPSSSVNIGHLIYGDQHLGGWLHLAFVCHTAATGSAAFCALTASLGAQAHSEELRARGTTSAQGRVRSRC
jgi:hypothetical protein